MLATAGSRFSASPHAVNYQLLDGSRAVWNALIPRVVVLNERAFNLFAGLPGTQERLSADQLEELEAARLVYRGNVDPTEDDFFRSAQTALDIADREAKAFYEERQPYESLTIVNSGCNLGCSYCISYYGDDSRLPAARQAERGAARTEAVMRVVDQFMGRKQEVGDREARLNFNGGEILLRWPIVESVLMRMRSRYPDIRVKSHMNTNATLLTPDIAARLAEFDVEIGVSIDGYRDLHDRTRHYHTGGGSFDRVLQGIANYRNATGRPMDHFQGTIRDFDAFENEKFFSMAEFGFVQARLEPNVLAIDAEKGIAAAEWEAKLAVGTLGEAVEVGKTHFERMLKLLEKGRDGFAFHCNGLNGLHIRALTLNIDSMQLSQMCSFVSPGAVPVADVKNDIYDPSLWTKTRQYIVDRMQMLRTGCKGCDVLGVCQGGCVYHGLDVDNKLNVSGCNYQRALFRHAIDYVHSGTLRPMPAGTIRTHPGDEPQSRGCHPTAPLRESMPVTFFRKGPPHA